ncbi:MAG: hypothetical protein CMK07_04920 [Ponticaulis sp.]|nr:hypothetical protein [Ponticaulis sp.]
MRLTVRKGLQALRAFGPDNKGVSAVEFALIAPILIAMTMMGISVSFKMLDRQRLDSAVTSTIYFLTDQTMSGDMTGFQPVAMTDETGNVTTVPGETMATAKHVLIDAYKSQATLIIREFSVECACPSSVSPADEGFDSSQPFYSRYAVEKKDEAPICSTLCPDRSLARIVAEISVTSQSSDLFGEAYEFDKQMMVRLR